MSIYCSKRIKLLLAFPTILFFGLYCLYPLVDSLKTGFYSKPMLRAGTFVGLDNYTAIFQDENFLKALMNTLIILICELLLMLPLGFLAGSFLHARFAGNEAVKVLVIAPYIMSGVMTGLLWFFILDPGIGLINGFLDSVGLHPLALKWIGGLTLTPYSVAIVDTWKTTGFYAVLFMAGLKMLPKHVYEAAIIDGASKRQQMAHVTLPLLKETIKICTVMIVISAINTFQTVFVLTGGGPYNKSHVLATLIYNTEFVIYDFGKGSAMAFIMFLAVMIISVSFLNLTRKRTED